MELHTNSLFQLHNNACTFYEYVFVCHDHCADNTVSWNLGYFKSNKDGITH